MLTPMNRAGSLPANLEHRMADEGRGVRLHCSKGIPPANSVPASPHVHPENAGCLRGVCNSCIEKEETEEELFRNAFAHGRKFHGMKEIPKDLQEKMRTLIREEKAA